MNFYRRLSQRIATELYAWMVRRSLRLAISALASAEQYAKGLALVSDVELVTMRFKLMAILRAIEGKQNHD